ncbi:MAG: signal recognition particle-docking protein FtsY [Pseudomonadota bacterium]
MFGKPKDNPEPENQKVGFIKRLRQKLNQGDSWLTYDLGRLMPGGQIDDELLEELETRLIMSDMGVDATQEIMNTLDRQITRKEVKDPAALVTNLKQSILKIVKPVEQPFELSEARPFVLLMVGVNGAGKTTTIGKLARRLLSQDLKVMLAAGDTFRAAAVEQLQVWGERNQVPVIAQPTGADPGAVIFDAIQAAKARDVDVLIADTAGRLHTQGNLMQELEKIKRVIQKVDPEAPHEVMLVLDATAGQNALSQARQFNQAVGVTGITITKLDGTAKGGILIAVAKELGLPIRFVGVGEKLEDLGVFDAEAYTDALLVGPGEPA